MRLLILLKSAPWQSQGMDTAWRLARAALEKGHALTLFCHQAGVANADARLHPAQDERPGAPRWAELRQRHGRLSLMLCPGSAGARGLFEGHAHLAEGFRLASLAQLAELCADADRVIAL